MEGTYALYLGDEPVGSVSLKQQGLYYKCHCRCQKLEGMFDVWLGKEKLGLLVPHGEAMVYDGRIPVKRAGEGKLSFSLRPRHAPMAGKFVPISPQEPFAYIRNLENAYLASHQGQVGAMINTEGCKKM